MVVRMVMETEGRWGRLEGLNCQGLP
jgi:hypothetical protein